MISRRTLSLLVWALLCCLLTKTTVAQERSALLEGVQEVTAPGGIPGDLVVLGDHAFVVLTGRMGGARLPVVAAAHFGTGRAVAAGHEAFFGSAALRNPDNLLLMRNIARWVSGKPISGLRIGLLDQDPALQTALTASGCQARPIRADALPAALKDLDLVWLDQASLDGAQNRVRVEAVRRWVLAGGGLVVTGPAWGWQSLHAGQDLARDHSGNQLLQQTGIAFSNGMLDSTGPHGFIAEAGDLSLTQANTALSALETMAAGGEALTPAQLEQATTTLGQAMAALPQGQAGFARRVETLCADKGGGAIPTKETPITRAMPFARLKAVLDWQRLKRLPPEQVKAHPSAVSFPGPVPADAKRESRTITLDTRVPEWHGTGLYAAPGEIVTITLPQTAVNGGLAIRIGSHTDTLWHLDKWERFPEITLSRPLDRATVRVASPFGGTLFVEVPDNCKLGDVPITITNAVAAPRFVRGVTSLDAWKQTIRNAPGPWAELEDRRVILSVPSYAVRDLDDPEALMAYWDEVMERCYTFFAAPIRPRPERYCVDRQISAGYMHSGYPIMTGEDVAKTFCDLSILRGPIGIKCWGFYHEMGHNFQQPEWTWESFGEVTNNLFSLYGTETLNGVKIGAHPAMTEAEIDKRMHIVASAPGKEHYYERDPWYPLTMFFLMRRQFGWQPFTKLFAEFRDLPNDQRPQTEADKHDQFLIRFSKLTGRNLTGYLAAWGVDASPQARDAVTNLPDWMPPDWPLP